MTHYAVAVCYARHSTYDGDLIWREFVAPSKNLAGRMRSRTQQVSICEFAPPVTTSGSAIDDAEGAMSRNIVNKAADEALKSSEKK